MKKLLLQSTIITLVSTGVTNGVTLEQNPTRTIGYTNLVFQPKKLKPITVVAAIPLHASFTFLPTITEHYFSVQRNAEGKLLNDLYDMSALDKTQGCIQIANINKTVAGGGLDNITASDIWFSSYSLNQKYNTIKKKHIKFLAQNGKCSTPSTNNFSTLSNALISVKIGSAFATSNFRERPTTTDGQIALYYRIPSNIINQLRIARPDTVKYAKDRLRYNESFRLRAELHLEVTMASL